MISVAYLNWCPLCDHTMASCSLRQRKKYNYKGSISSYNLAMGKLPNDSLQFYFGICGNYLRKFVSRARIPQVQVNAGWPRVECIVFLFHLARSTRSASWCLSLYTCRLKSWLFPVHKRLLLVFFYLFSIFKLYFRYICFFFFSSSTSTSSSSSTSTSSSSSILSSSFLLLLLLYLLLLLLLLLQLHLLLLLYLLLLLLLQLHFLLLLSLRLFSFILLRPLSFLPQTSPTPLGKQCRLSNTESKL